MKCRHEYKDADKYVLLNEDDSILRPICLKIPSPPKVELIDGYGKPPEEQYFRRIKQPVRLEELEKRALYKAKNTSDSTGHKAITGYKIHHWFWKLLTEEAEKYKEELVYIKQMWWYLVYGYWFYNDGKPTWIAPQHFWYLQFMYVTNTDQYFIEPHYPNYRDPDRVDAIADWYAYTTKETFADLDKKGNALKTNGKYIMKNLTNRSCFGMVRPKRRRSGESMKGIVWVRRIAGLTFGAKCVITSDSEDNAQKKLYEKMCVPSWRKEPLWLRPVSDVNNKAVSGLSFTAPSNAYDVESLDSVIMVDTARENANDGDKLNGGMFDEEGKQKNTDVYEKWEINKKTMCQGASIHGYAYHPSTVEEMNEGGYAFERLFKESDFYIRIPGVGQTVSGCFRTFRKAYANYDGFFDRWGNAVTERPTNRQLKYAPKGSRYITEKIGAKDYIMLTREFLLRQNTPESLNKLRQIIRKDPIDSTECFIGQSGDIGFNVQILDERIAQLNHKTETVSGDFKWLDGFGSKVIWVPNERGRWENSNVLNPNETNLLYPDEVYSHKQQKNIKAWRPMRPERFIATADSFDYSNTEIDMTTGARYSDGGGSVFQRRLPTDTSLNPSEWEGHNFVCSYRYRPPSIYEYCEDMLKMTLFYGALMYFERNKTIVWDYFVENGYGKCLGHLMGADGKMAEKPGYYLQDKTDLIDALRDYIQFKGMKEKHLKLLEEARSIGAPKQLTKYDLLAAAGGALIANKSVYGDVISQENDENMIDISDFDGFFTQNTY